MTGQVADSNLNWCAPIDSGLQALLARLEGLSLKPEFRDQREMAISLVLEPYIDTQQDIVLSPLPEEVRLAELYVYADFQPTIGFVPLVEQVRDMVTDHVPQEERAWLDPLRRSFVDLLQIVEMGSTSTSGELHLRSLGTGEDFHVPIAVDSSVLKPGRVILTRLIQRGDRVSLPGAAVVISETIGKAVFRYSDELRREVEMGGGEFALGDWGEFAKRYGYVLIWNLAKVRRGALAVAETKVEYRDETGQPYLSCIALYEHHAFQVLSRGLGDLEGLTFNPSPETESRSEGAADSNGLVWVKYSKEAGTEVPATLVARVTLTATQLIVETNSPQNLDALKHELASVFGFSLHFRGETVTPPTHPPPQVDLLSDTFLAPPVIVSKEEEHRLLSEFLEAAYLDWAERPSAALDGETPRRYAHRPEGKQVVAGLIQNMERHDLARRRTGKPGYDYNVLREHIGLEPGTDDAGSCQ